MPHRLLGLATIILITAAAPTLAATVCLTNNDPAGPNIQLPDGCYRMLWAGTNQPYVPGDPRLRDWVSFATGRLTNGNTGSTLGMSNIWMERNKFTGYSWGKNDWELEIDLGQVCNVNAFELFGGHKTYTFKVFYPKAGRWLPLTKGENKIKLSNLAVRKIRVELHDVKSPGSMTYSEFRIWGEPLPEGAKEQLPPPPPPHANVEAGNAQPLALRSATIATRAPDPFVFPNPVQMQFGDEHVYMPLGTQLILADESDAELRKIAEVWVKLANRLYYWDVTITKATDATADKPKLFLGLSINDGPTGKTAEAFDINPKSIAAEGYALQTTDDGVVMVGIDHDGAQWATRSLLFLAKPQKAGGVKIPKGHIRDYPRSSHRFAAGYPSWSGPFKAGLLQSASAIKTNQTTQSIRGICTEIAAEERWYTTHQAMMFPGSYAGSAGDILEMTPRGKRNDLDLTRLSACPMHFDFWPRMYNVFPKEPTNGRDIYVAVGYDEMLDNPFVICARCRATGVSQRDMIGDSIVKVRNAVIPKGYKIQIYATGYKAVSEAFDCFEDVPTDNMIVFNYNRPRRNKMLADLGYTVIAGRDGNIVDINNDSAITSGITWNWGSGTRAEMMAEYVPIILMQAEENWSLVDRQFEVDSPEWTARRNRITDFARHIIDYEPIEPADVEREYFTIDLSKHTNRTLKDEAYADGKGFIDDGPTRDLRYLPRGKQTFDGEPFELTDRAIIVTGEGSSDTMLPKQVTNIPVNRKAGKFTFLHACTKPIWQSLGRQVVLVGNYRIRYDDDTVVSWQVNYGQHLREWDEDFGYRDMTNVPIEEPCPDANVAWRGSTAGGDDVTLYSFRWRNPYPSKTVKSIDVIGSGIYETGSNNLILLAVTGRAATPLDERVTEANPFTPPLRPYYERKPLPKGIVAMDLTRNTSPPPDTSVSYYDCQQFQTDDRWVTASCSMPFLIKSELSFGAYSALHPDDDPWRINDSTRVYEDKGGQLEITLKQAVPLHAVGIKPALQNIKTPHVLPSSFYVMVLRSDKTWNRLPAVKDWLSTEGEYRYQFDEPIESLGMRLVITKADGISSVKMYVPEGAVPDARLKDAPKVLTPGEQPKDDKSLEELLDDVEGF